MDKKTKIAILMGGPSAEVEVSRNTGKAIAEALKSKGYNVITMELHPATVMQELKEQKIEMVFNALHGLYGEDGRIQSILESMDMPYTSSGVVASVLSMDKSVTKRIFTAENIPTAEYLIFNKKFDINNDMIVSEILSKIGIPVVVKAACQGSSIGVEIVKDEKDLLIAVEKCFKYCDNIVAEKFICGKEVTCGVMKIKGKVVALPVIWIAPHSGAYDYYSKYTKGATDYHCPAPFPDSITKEIQKWSEKTYRVLGLSGVARIDMMMDEKNNVYVLEANTVPGMTATSLVPKMAAAMGISFPDLCEMILLENDKE